MWQADRTILSSQYSFPSERCVISIPSVEKSLKSRIADCSRMILHRHGLRLGFDDNSLWVYTLDGHVAPECGVVVNFISYKSFLDFNILTGLNEPDYPLLNRDVDRVVFNLVKIVEKREQEDGNIAVWHEEEPYEIVLAKQDVENYLQAIDLHLAYAIYYYLMGCNTTMYFLIEFYKCLEVIKDRFNNEKELFQSLTGFGFDRALYNSVKRQANDQSKPLSIGRHAAYPGVPIIHVDTKSLFNDLRGKKIFEEGENACRNIIDSYIQYRLSVK